MEQHFPLLPLKQTAAAEAEEQCEKECFDKSFLMPSCQLLRPNIQFVWFELLIPESLLMLFFLIMTKLKNLSSVIIWSMES